jgi:hypothetical protein
MQACKFCGTAIDPEAATAAAQHHVSVQRACAEASSIRISATGIPLLFLASFLPFIGFIALAGMLADLLIVPFMILRWHRRFGGLASPDPDLPRAVQSVKLATQVWGAMLVVTACWFGFRIVQSNRTLNW